MFVVLLWQGHEFWHYEQITIYCMHAYMHVSMHACMHVLYSIYLQDKEILSLTARTCVVCLCTLVWFAWFIFLENSGGSDTIFSLTQSTFGQKLLRAAGVDPEDLKMD